MAHASIELFQPQSAYFVELTRLVLSCSVNDVRAVLSDPEQGRFRGLLEALLDVPAPPSDGLNPPESSGTICAGCGCRSREGIIAVRARQRFVSELLVQVLTAFPVASADPDPAVAEEPDAYAAG